MVFIYTTCPDVKSAKRIGESLLKKRLAACCNYWSIQSSYRWKDKIQHDREAALLIKTIKKHIDRAKRLIEERHPYKAPCIAVLSAKQFNAKYKKWLTSECR